MSISEMRAKRLLRREVRRELYELRLAHQELDAEAFRKLAMDHMQEEWAELDPETWDVIIKLIIELLPLILLLLK